MHKALGIPEIAYNVVLHLESQDLVRVALVSTAFSRQAQAVLFRHIKINKWDISTYYFLRMTLDRQPELLHLIRSVDLTLPEQNWIMNLTCQLQPDEYWDMKWGENRFKDVKKSKSHPIKMSLRPPKEGAFLTKEEYVGLWIEGFLKYRTLGCKQPEPAVAHGRLLLRYFTPRLVEYFRLSARLYMHCCTFLLQIPNLRSVSLSYPQPYNYVIAKDFVKVMKTDKRWNGKNFGCGFENLRELHGGDELFCWFLSKISPPPRLTSVTGIDLLSMKTYFPKEMFHALTSLKAPYWRRNFQNWICNGDAFSQLGSLSYVLFHPMQPRPFVFPPIHSLSIGGYSQRAFPSTFLDALMDTPTLKHIELAIKHSCIEDPMFSRYLERVPKTNLESVTLRIKGNKMMISDPSLEYLSSCGFSGDSEVMVSDRTWCTIRWKRP